MGERVDGVGAAYAGSQLQTQLWVNAHPEQLATEVAAAFSDLHVKTITWVSPLRTERFREYQDRAFLRQVGLDHLQPQLSAFWPTGGPVWDGLGVVGGDDEQAGVILLEGKSYPRELYGSGCQAGEAIVARANGREGWLQDARRQLTADGSATPGRSRGRGETGCWSQPGDWKKTTLARSKPTGPTSITARRGATSRDDGSVARRTRINQRRSRRASQHDRPGLADHEDGRAAGQAGLQRAGRGESEPDHHRRGDRG